MSKEKFIIKARNIHKDLYDYKNVEYNGCKTKVNIICCQHGEFLQTPDCHINGKQGCPKCAKIRVGKFKAKPKDGKSLINLEPELSKEWSDKNQLGPENYRVGSNKKVWWKCRICDYEWKTQIIHRTRGCNCPQCFGNNIVSNRNSLIKNYPSLSKEWDYSKNTDTPSDISYGSDKKRWWICTKCNKSYDASISKRTLENTGCPKCRHSKGEKKIQNFLLENNIEYVTQYRIKECKNIRPLPFDFAIQINEKLYLIEFHGEQHYKTGKGFFACDKSFKLRKINDKIKHNYCKNNKLNLVIISYKDYTNIEQILTNLINGD